MGSGNIGIIGGTLVDERRKSRLSAENPRNEMPVDTRDIPYTCQCDTMKTSCRTASGYHMVFLDLDEQKCLLIARPCPFYLFQVHINGATVSIPRNPTLAVVVVVSCCCT